MSNQQPDYLSYLLRLWRENSPGRTVWRASLERSLAGERQVFASLGDVVEYLRQRMGVVLDAEADESETRT